MGKPEEARLPSKISRGRVKSQPERAGHPQDGATLVPEKLNGPCGIDNAGPTARTLGEKPGVLFFA